MVKCEGCGKKIGFFEKRYFPKHDPKLNHCKECAKPFIAIEEEKKKKEEKKREEERKKEEQKKRDEKFLSSIMSMIKGEHQYMSSKNFLNVSLMNAKKIKDTLLIMVQATFSYNFYDGRNTYSNMMQDKKWAFEKCIGYIVTYLNIEFEKNEFPSMIIIKFYGDKIDKYGHAESCYYSTIQIDVKTLNKMNFDNLSISRIADLFIKEIKDFPNDLG